MARRPGLKADAGQRGKTRPCLQGHFTECARNRVCQMAYLLKILHRHPASIEDNPHRREYPRHRSRTQVRGHRATTRIDKCQIDPIRRLLPEAVPLVVVFRGQVRVDHGPDNNLGVRNTPFIA